VAPGPLSGRNAVKLHHGGRQSAKEEKSFTAKKAIIKKKIKT